MKRTAVKSITDYAFQSDFSPPEPVVEETADTVSVTAGELAELLANARRDGAASAQTKFENEHSDRLASISEELKTALEGLLALAERLDQSALSPAEQSDTKQLIAAACTHIVNGQRDLFADQ